MMKRIFKKKSPPAPPFILYPNMAEADAYDKLFWKKEFLNTRYGAEFMNNTSDTTVCKHRSKEDFELQNPQEFVKNLISPETNYNGLLILHGTGVGKTCSAIGITEGLRDYIHKNGKKMFIITPSENIRENFLKELRLTGCAKNNYDKKIIDEYYVFMGFGQFSNFIDRTLKQNPEELDRHFSNSIIIIDEAHGIAKPPGKKEDQEDKEQEEDQVSEGEDGEDGEEDEEEDEETAEPHHLKRRTLFSVLTKTIIPHTKGLKLVLLTATPMKDNITEMADLIEILNNNDDRMVPKEFRQKLIRFKENKIDISEIRDDLLYYSKGYVSFARGNNPISFPREIKPPFEQLYSPQPTYAFEDGQAFDYTVTNPFNLSFEYNYELVKCPMGSAQYKAYEKLYSLKMTEKNYTQKLSWISNMLLPRTTQDMDLKAAFQRTFPALKKKDIGDLGLRYEIKKEDAKLFQSNLSDYSGKMSQFVLNVRQSPGIAFAYSEFITYGTKIAAFLLELNGFVHYHPDLYQNLHNGQPTDAFLPHCTLLKCSRTNESYTCTVCGERLSRHTDKNHTFLFNTYVLITGETDKRNRMNYIKTASTNPAQCKCGKLYENHDGEDHPFDSVVIGKSSLMLPPMDQRYGQVIKTVIGTRIIGQGVDFKWIRQVHVLEPWHNNTRIYQVIGRGLRHCSHADLPKAEREVMVYRYCSAPNLELTTGTETIDEHVYARVMRKDIQVKQIERVLKENAVDCEFNRHLNMMPNDKDYTRECDYMPCKYTCQGYANPIKYNEIRVGRRPSGEWFVFDKTPNQDFDYASLPVVNETTRALGPNRFVTLTPNGAYLLEEPITELKDLIAAETDLTDNLEIWKYLLDLGGKIVTKPRGEYLYLDLPLNGVPDMSTYDIYFQKPLINKVEKIIYKLFTRKIIYTLKTLMYYIKNEITIEDAIIYLALDSLLINKTVIKDIHEREGYLINKGIFYIFQPTYLIDKTIPLYYREADIPYKFDHAPIPFTKLQVEQAPPFNVDDIRIKKDSYYAKMNATPDVLELAELNNSDFTEEIKNIISELFEISATGMYKNKKLAIISTRYGKNQDDWQWTMPLKSEFDFALFVLLDFQGFKIWGGQKIPTGRVLAKSAIADLTPIQTLDDLDAFIL